MRPTLLAITSSKSLITNVIHRVSQRCMRWYSECSCSHVMTRAPQKMTPAVPGHVGSLSQGEVNMNVTIETVGISRRLDARRAARHLLGAFFMVLFAFLIVGCGSESILAPGSDQATLEIQARTLRRVYSAQLADLMSSGADLTDEAAVLDRTVTFYASEFGGESRDFALIEGAVRQRRADTVAPKGLLVDTPLQRLVGRVNEAADRAQTLTEFHDALEQFQGEVLSSADARADRQAELSYLVLLDETLRVLSTARGGSPASLPVGMSMTTASSEMFSFWRCAAGVVGGAILGGFTGAGGGSVIPALGTAAGGVIGAVAEGLVGAATSC